MDNIRVKATFKCPPLLQLKDGVWNWKQFKQQYDIYMKATGLGNNDSETKVAIFLNLAGQEAIELFNSFDLTQEEKDNIDFVTAAFEGYCCSDENLIYKSFKFFTRVQAPNETFDDFYNDLKIMAEFCNFGDQKDRMIRDRIVVGINNDSLQQEFLKNTFLSLEEAVKKCIDAELELKSNENNVEMLVIEPKVKTEILEEVAESIQESAINSTSTVDEVTEPIKKKRGRKKKSELCNGNQSVVIDSQNLENENSFETIELTLDKNKIKKRGRKPKMRNLLFIKNETCNNNNLNETANTKENVTLTKRKKIANLTKTKVLRNRNIFQKKECTEVENQELNKKKRRGRQPKNLKPPNEEVSNESAIISKEKTIPFKTELAEKKKRSTCELLDVKTINGQTLLIKTIKNKKIVLGKMPYKCKKCEECFWTSNLLEKHELVHVLKKAPSTSSAPKKVFTCDLCQRSFKKICDLERHTRVHTGEKPSQCKICYKRFQQSYNLSKHLLTHTQEKQFECIICGKKFGRSDVLNRHVLTHSVDKPFHCNVCPKMFIRGSQLNLHMKNRHPEVKFEPIKNTA